MHFSFRRFGREDLLYHQYDEAWETCGRAAQKTTQFHSKCASHLCFRPKYEEGEIVNWIDVYVLCTSILEKTGLVSVLHEPHIDLPCSSV